MKLHRKREHGRKKRKRKPKTGLTEKGEVIGEFVKHKYMPNVYKKLTSRGITDLKDIFEIER